MAKISNGMQGFMNDFLEAKRSFYGWDEETFNRKADNFRSNVKKVKFKPQAQGGNVKGVYMYKKGKVVLAMDGDNVDSRDTKSIAHELNHAFNHEDGKRMNLIKIEGKKIPKEMIRYKVLSEIVNEAETQVLFDKFGKTDRDFGLYIETQPVFEMLCVSCNQDATTFLRGIEGKDIDGLTSYIAEHSGHSLADAQSYVNAISDELNSFREKTAQDLQVVDREQPAYRKIVSINENFIQSSQLDDSKKSNMQELITGIKENEFYSLRETQARKIMFTPPQARINNTMQQQVTQVVRQGKTFEWGVPETTTKMGRTYTGLDNKRTFGKKHTLALSSAQPHQTLNTRTAVEQPSISEARYNVPPAPTMIQCMPDLAKVNTPEETAKSYAEISARQAEAPIKTVHSISAQSVGVGGAAGGGMVR